MRARRLGRVTALRFRKGAKAVEGRGARVATVVTTKGDMVPAAKGGHGRRIAPSGCHA